MKIVAMPDGPYMIETTELLSDAEGRELKAPLYLCRCGASGHKPHCDGTHKASGFKAPGSIIVGKRRG